MTAGENATEVACQRLLEKLSSVKTRQLSSMLVFRWEKTATATARAFRMSSQGRRGQVMLRVGLLYKGCHQPT